MSRAYLFAFNVGLGGTLVLVALAIYSTTYRLQLLSLMAIWMLITMFFLPPLYVIAREKFGL